MIGQRCLLAAPMPAQLCRHHTFSGPVVNEKPVETLPPQGAMEDLNACRIMAETWKTA